MRKNSFFKAVVCLTIAAMLMGLNFIPAFAASPATDFTFNASTRTITGYHGAGGNVVIPGEIGGVSVNSIGFAAFRGCSSLSSITIPDSVTSIEVYAFSCCSSLTSVDIPDSVTSIGNYAFGESSDLTSINIPASVTSIGNCAFSWCNNLSNITVDAGNKVYASADGVLFNKAMTELVECSGGKSGSYSIPSSVTSIGNSAFYGCSILTSITIPSSVISIGDNAFFNCISVTSITIPASVTNIRNSAFYQCSSLTSITIPSSITSIGDYAFNGCSSLASITIPSSVTNIGYAAFDRCSKLTINTSSGSYAENYAISHSIPISYINIPPAFTVQYYSDMGLTNSLGNNPRLKAGTYYLKITANAALNGSPTIRINAEGTANDVSNASTALASGNTYRYTRTIANDTNAVGSILEDISISGTDTAGNTALNVDPTNEGIAAAYTDTVAPQVSISAPSSTLTKGEPITYTVTYSGANSITLGASDLTLNKTGTANGTVSVSGTGTTTRTVTISNITGYGTLGISIGAGTATDNAENSALSVEPSAVFTADITPPMLPPTNVRVVSVTDTSVTLAWDALPGNVGVTGYEVYRDGTKIGTTPGLTITNIPLTPGKTYNYTVRAYDASGNYSALSSPVAAATNNDTQAPTVPAGLSAPSATETSITLAWTAATDNVAIKGYDLYRDGAKVGTTPGLSYCTGPLTPGKTYNFTLKAYDAAGNYSDLSSPLAASTLADTTPPQAPSGLTASNVTETGATLTWSPSTDNSGIRCYNIYRNDVLIGSLTATTYQAVWLTPGTTYTFAIKAVDLGNNESQASTPITVTTLNDTVKPSTPTGLSVTGVTGASVELSWTASTDDSWVTGYEVYRDGVKIATTTATTLENTRDVEPGRTYSYTVKACDVAGNLSDESASVVVTTPGGM